MQVLIELDGIRVIIDGESVSKTNNIRFGDLTPARQYESVIADSVRLVVGPRNPIFDLMFASAYMENMGWNESNSQRLEEFLDIRFDIGDIGFIETDSNQQIGFWSQDDNLHIFPTCLFQDSGGTKSRPYSCPPGTDYDDARRMVVV